MRKNVVMGVLVCVLFLDVYSQISDSAAHFQDSVLMNLNEKVLQLEGKLEGINEPFLEMQTSVSKLNKVKVSGYLQMQFRYADTVPTTLNPIGDFAGGKFKNGVQSHFQIRRSRFKIAYDNGLTQAAFQLDVTPAKVATKEAYLQITEPYLRSTGIKAGLFDRPFGFEVSYSSSSIESPERSRVMQTLFKDEKDVGVVAFFKPDENLLPSLSIINLQAGLFTGNAIADESDNEKDFIGRVGVSVPLSAQNLSIDGGISYYGGSINLANDTVYSLIANKWVPVSSSNNRKKYDRNYVGADVQFYYDVPIVGGASVRAEYVMGTQPGSGSSTVSPTSDAGFTSSLYSRDFNGYYALYLQNIGGKFQGAIKYDVYDPNTEIDRSEVTKSGDISYSTIGGGVIFHLDANVKFTAWYDYIRNEKTAVAGYTADAKDNVFTARMQYKF